MIRVKGDRFGELYIEETCGTSGLVLIFLGMEGCENLKIN